MINYETFRVLGVGMPSIDKTIFELVFSIDDCQYILTNVVLNKGENETAVWELAYCDIYHYTAPEKTNEPKTCGYCAYTYESARPISDELLCAMLNEPANFEEIWKRTLVDEQFKEMMTTLLKRVGEELNETKK